MENAQQAPTSGGYSNTGAMRASNAYKASNFEGLDQKQLMVEASRVMLQKLHMGRDAYRARKLDDMTNHHAKIFAILALLLQTLEQAEQGLDAETRLAFAQFKGFYRGINDRIVYILYAASVEDEFAKIIEELTGFYRLWQTSKSDASTESTPESPLSGGAIGRMA